MKKYWIWGVLVIMSLIFASCDATQLNEDNENASEEPETIAAYKLVEVETVDTSHLTAESLIDISNIDDYNVIITNKSDHYNLELYRELLGQRERCDVVLAGESFIDTVPFDGTSYRYFVTIDGQEINGHLDVTTSISPETLGKTGFYTWEKAVLSDEFSDSFYQDKLLTVSNEAGSQVLSTYLNGVKFSTVYDGKYVKASSEEERQAIFDHASTYFHRFMLMYGGFPLDEYKLMVIDSDQPFPMGARVYGYVFEYSDHPDAESNVIHEYGIIAHEIGHAWNGNILYNVSGDDGWYIEGVNLFNEYLVIDGDKVIPSLGSYQKNICSLLEHNLYHSDEHKAISEVPLKDIRDYSLDPYGAGDYVKGALFTGKIYQRFIENNVDYLGFQQYVYKTYYVDIVNSIDPHHKGFVVPQVMNSYIFQEALETYSKISFYDLFSAHVFGTQAINFEKFSLKSIHWDY